MSMWNDDKLAAGVDDTASCTLAGSAMSTTVPIIIALILENLKSMRSAALKDRVPCVLCSCMTGGTLAPDVCGMPRNSPFSRLITDSVSGIIPLAFDRAQMRDITYSELDLRMPATPAVPRRCRPIRSADALSGSLSSLSCRIYCSSRSKGSRSPRRSVASGRCLAAMCRSSLMQVLNGCDTQPGSKQ